MFVVLPVTALCVIAAVVVHCQALLYLSDWLEKQLRHRRYPIVMGVFGALIAHIIEVSIFSLAYFLLDSSHYGELKGATTDDFTNDYWYYSFVSYTSLGFGDIVPTGWLRYMTAVETLTGLVLIAWTASFLYMQMHRIFDNVDELQSPVETADSSPGPARSASADDVP